MRLAVTIIVIMITMANIYGSGEAMQITDNSEPVATIVVPTEPSPAEEFAASELQSYIEKISGAKLAIVGELQASEAPRRLFVGASSRAGAPLAYLKDFDPESFVVRTVNDDLLLVGGCGRGTLYAVYDFLEQELGCRWLAPGPDWEEVPQQPTVELGQINRVEHPGLKYRHMPMTLAGEPDTWPGQCMSWAVKQRSNIGRQERPELGGFRAPTLTHTTWGLPKADHYFTEHPEWFALIDGKRQNRGAGTQVCTTNPDVIEIVAESLGNIFDENPDAEFLSLGQADGVAFCECERCRALDTGEIWPYHNRNLPVITERWLTFVNAVARKLQVTHPGKKLFTLAYHQTFRPPDPQVIKPEPNVMIEVELPASREVSPGPGELG